MAWSSRFRIWGSESSAEGKVLAFRVTDVMIRESRSKDHKKIVGVIFKELKGTAVGEDYEKLRGMLKVRKQELLRRA